MKITCSRRDDLILERDRYDAAKQAHDEASDAVWRKYEHDVKAVTDQLVAKIQDKLAPFDKLAFDIDVREGWEGGFEARITCNEYNKFDDNVALAWDWTTNINRDGVAESKTGSWSGLSATTPEQIESLEQSVNAIKVLNGIDWKTLLSAKKPNYGDYKKDIPAFELGERPDYETLINEAEIDECIGANKLIECREGKVYVRSYMGIVSSTPAMYTVFEIPKTQVDNILSGQGAQVWDSQSSEYVVVTKLDDLVEVNRSATFKVKKETFVDKNVKYPLNIIEY